MFTKIFGKSGNRATAATDEDVRLDAFKEHWRQVKPVLESTGPWSIGQRSRESIESGITSVRANVNSLTQLLASELRSSTQLGKLLDYSFEEKIFKRLCVWALQPGAHQNARVLDQLRMYEALVAESERCILHDKPLLEPLFSLLGYYRTAPTHLETDQIVSQLIQSLCLWIGRDPSLLPVFFCCGQGDQGKTGFLLFSLLLSHVYRDGQVGDRARDSMLLIFSHSARCSDVSEYIANSSNFCPVLAAGLSGLYSSLPRRLEFRGDEFCSLERHHWESVPSLRSFMQSLLFINSVCELAEPQVLDSLLSYLHSGFLVPVLGPSLHKTNQEEALCSIAYLDLFVRSITSESLLRLILKFIVVHEHEGVPILETLTQRLASNHRECLSALSLFSTLISLHCEDFIFQLILRFLIPCSHMLWTQRSICRQNENLSVSAERFLNLTPRLLVKRQSQSAQFRINEDLSLSATDDEDIDGTLQEEVDMEDDLAQVGAVPGAVDQIPFSYMDYLEDARATIASSRQQTAAWLFDYDGINPSVNFFAEMKLLQPVPEHVAEKTQEIFMDFLASESSELVTLDQLGIHVPIDDQSPLDPLLDLPMLSECNVENQIVEKVMSKQHSRTEVDEFYRTLMGDANHELSTIDDDDLSNVDLSNAEELFNADITAVEDSINEINEEDSNMDESDQLPDTSKTDEENNDDEKHENSILELCDVDGQLNELGDEFLDHQASSTIPMPIKLTGAPYLGPFLSTMLGRLEQMPTNSLYLNLMLTGIITKLGSMTLPLLRGLLLDTRIIFQPGVPSLYQVLNRVKGKLEAFASSCPEYLQLCNRANQFLLQRETDITSRPEVSKKFDFKEIESKLRKKRDEAEKMILAAKLNHELKQKYATNPLRVKNAIYASVVLKEFAKELSSLAHEHTVSY